MTTHKLLMYQTDYSITGDMVFVRNINAQRSSMIPEYELVIIDECSMINIEMIDIIFNEMRNRNLHLRTPKVIFSGDPAQLPPVNEERSIIFHNDKDTCDISQYMTHMLHPSIGNTIESNVRQTLELRYATLMKEISSTRTFLLTNVVRSKINDVLQVCHKFREWVGSNTMPDMSMHMSATGIYFYDCAQYKENKLSTQWFSNFVSNIKRDDKSIILTWTNKQTDQYNNTIRKIVFDKETINKFEKDDILMLADFYNIDDIDSATHDRLYTSEQIKICETICSEVSMKRFNKPKYKQYMFRNNIVGTIDKIVEALNDKYCTNQKLKVWKLTVRKLGEENSKVMTIIVIDDTDMHVHTKLRNESSGMLIAFVNVIINTYKNIQINIERDIINPLWKQWHKIFVEPFASVNYGYSITCHKSQGSNFYNVFVDIDDILQNPHKIEARRCAYTAVTRTCNELHLLV